MFPKHPLAALVALLPFYIASVNAKNDWSVPCTSGICEWDTTNGDTTGNVILTADPSALSDITTAAGWHILDCDPKSLDPQTIRLVCESANPTEAGCDALHQGGAENTIVRLPNSCGGGPFARLARIWDSPDQSIPEEARKRFRKRDGVPGQVQNAEIDYKFANVPPTPGKEVEILATGSNNKQAPIDKQAARLRRAYSSQKMRRSLFERAPPPSTAAPAAGSGKPPAPGSAKSKQLVKEFLQKLGELNNVGVRKDGGIPVSVTKSGFPIAAGEIGCEAKPPAPSFKGSLSVSADVNVDGLVSYGFAVQGKVVPPTLDDVGYYAAFTGNANALWHVATSVEIEVLTKRLEVINIPLSPLSVPGFVNIGPKFSVGLAGIAKVGLTGKMDVGTSLNIPKIEMRYPPKNAGPSSGSVAPVKGKSPITLSVAPSGTVGGAFEGHLTPRLALGVDMINGFAKAEVFMELDSKLGVDLGITAKKVLDTTAKPTNVEGCVTFSAGVGVQAGAEGQVFPFFDKTLTVNIFNKDFELHKQCFTPGQQGALSSGSAKPTSSAKAPGDVKGALIGAGLVGAGVGQPKVTVPPQATASAPPKVAPTAVAPAKATAVAPAKAPPAAAPPKGKVPAAAAPAPKKGARSLLLHSREADADEQKLKCPTVISGPLNLISLTV